jgi:hypothetical protein
MPPLARMLRASARRSSDGASPCCSLSASHLSVVTEIVGAIEMAMNVYGQVNLTTQRAALNQLDEALND